MQYRPCAHEQAHRVLGPPLSLRVGEPHRGQRVGGVEIFVRGNTRGRQRSTCRFVRALVARVWLAWGMKALVITWGPGGNLPPLLATASILSRRGHDVTVLCSGKTRDAAQRLRLRVTGYERSPDPDVEVAFEAQAAEVMAIAAGADIALDVADAVAQVRPDLAVVDCMLPAGIAAARAGATSTASLVHFLYCPARTQMLQSGSAWTTDLATLAATYRLLGLTAPRNGLSAWEAPGLVRLTASAIFPNMWCMPGPWASRCAGAFRVRQARLSGCS